jgi:hypothetical protein
VRPIYGAEDLILVAGGVPDGHNVEAVWHAPVEAA